MIVNIAAAWIQVDPDGSECFACGDHCYLTQFELRVKVDGSLIDVDSIAAACCSCADAAGIDSL